MRICLAITTSYTPASNGRKCKWIRCLPPSSLSAWTQTCITSFGRKTERLMEICMKYFVYSVNFPCIKMKFPKTCPILILIFTLDRRRNHIHIPAFYPPLNNSQYLTRFSNILEKKNVCSNFQNSHLDVTVLKPVNSDPNHWFNRVPIHIS